MKKTTEYFIKRKEHPHELLLNGNRYFTNSKEQAESLLSELQKFRDMFNRKPYKRYDVYFRIVEQ